MAPHKKITKTEKAALHQRITLPATAEKLRLLKEKRVEAWRAVYGTTDYVLVFEVDGETKFNLVSEMITKEVEVYQKILKLPLSQGNLLEKKQGVVNCLQSSATKEVNGVKLFSR